MSPRFDRRFVPLHLPSDGSLLACLNTVDALLDYAARNRLPALALTDAGNLFHALRFHRRAVADRGLKPILGMEVPVSGPWNGLRRPVLLALDGTGYRRLVRLADRLHAGARGIDFETELLADPQGTALLCGGADGLLGPADPDDRARLAGALRDAYGGDLYLEIYWNGLPREKDYNRAALELATALKLPVLATDPGRYLADEEKGAFACLLAEHKDPRERERLAEGDRALKSVDRMEKLFGHRPELLRNTVALAERCNVTFDFPPVSMPRYPAPPDFTEAGYLRKLVLDRLPPAGSGPDPYRERAERELAVIAGKNLAGYFLVIWDLVAHAKRKGVLTGPGRGSVCGSLVAYLLGITDIDPVEHGLLFERFLNAERQGLPDIDVDVPHIVRSKVLAYFAKRYAPERVLQIASFGTFRAKAALRAAARHLNESGPKLEALVARLGRSDEALAAALTGRADPADERLLVGNLPAVARLAKGLLDRKHNLSTHAAGIVIAPPALAPYIPVIERGDEALAVSAFDMDDLAAMGIVKFDILAVKALTVVADTLRRAKIRLALREMDLTRPEVYREIGRGHTFGVFQLESSEMRKFLRRLKPANFAELIDGLALFRPGPLAGGMVDAYLERRPPDFPPVAREILASTRGVLVYQEQVMEIARRAAGFTLERADALRDAMAKKKGRLLEELRDAFLAGAETTGVPEADARRLFDALAKFGEYGFNRSHAAAYAQMSYLTMHLKLRHPHHYLAALLNQETSNPARIEEAVGEAARLGVRVLSPGVNGPLRDFRSTRHAIQFPLAAIRGIGEQILLEFEAMRRTHPSFASLSGFLEAARHRPLVNGALAPLAKCGALDEFGVTRKGLLLHLGGDPLDAARAMDEFADDDVREDEIALLGVHLSGGTGPEYALLRAAAGIADAAGLATAPVGCRRLLLGSLRRTRNGSLEFRDGEGSLVLVPAPGTRYERSGTHVVEAVRRDDGWHATRLRPVEEVRHAAALSLRVPAEALARRDGLAETLYTVVRDHRGRCPLKVEIVHADGSATGVETEIPVLVDEQLLARLAAFSDCLEVRLDPFPEVVA